jgi:hypothetical protein
MKMVRYYTQYWTNDTWRYMTEIKAQIQSYRLARAGSNIFRNRGVKPGDYVYIVTVIDGELFLGGRIHVDKILDQDQVEKYHEWGYKIWVSQDHIVSLIDSAMEFEPDRKVAFHLVKKLRFHSSGDLKPLKMVNGNIDRQTLRGVRRLSEKSAMLLDELFA